MNKNEDNDINDIDDIDDEIEIENEDN